MNRTDVTTEGLKNLRPGREATVGVNTGPTGSGLPSGFSRRPRRRTGGEEPMVPKAEFRSYYGKPIINNPVWEGRDIASYLFLGGLAGAGSVLAAGAQLSGRRTFARVMKLGSAGAVGLSLAALVHDLGRRGRFLNMLRTFKPTSPMSVGSWILAGYGPMATVAAASDLTGVAPAAGVLATAGAAALGPALATYTAALISNTAVPAWHDAHREMPFVFAASATSSAAGLAMLGAPVSEAGPARLLGAVAGAGELLAMRTMHRRMGLSAEAFEEGKAKRYRKLAEPLTLAGTLGAAAGSKSRVVSAIAGAALVVGSALARFAIFEAGMNSALDPKYTVVPQRARLDARAGRLPSTPASTVASTSASEPA